MKELELISDEFYGLKITNDNGDYHIRLDEYKYEETLFDYRCGTFITGDLILHLREGIAKCQKNGKPIVLSRWYPHISKLFMIPLEPYPYISTRIEKVNGDMKIFFRVFLQDMDEPIVFGASSLELSKVL